MNIKHIKVKLTKQRIACTKYHHNLDSSQQNSTQLHSELYLENDTIVILSFKPLAGDTRLSEENHKIEVAKKSSIYSESKSNASFHLSEVRGIIYGGFSS